MSPGRRWWGWVGDGVWAVGSGAIGTQGTAVRDGQEGSATLLSVQGLRTGVAAAVNQRSGKTARSMPRCAGPQPRGHARLRCLASLPAHAGKQAPSAVPDPPCRDDGVGLAAPQVGVNVRLMVFNEAGEKGKGEEVRRGASAAGPR